MALLLRLAAPERFQLAADELLQVVEELGLWRRVCLAFSAQVGQDFEWNQILALHSLYFLWNFLLIKLACPFNRCFPEFCDLGSYN